MKVEGVKCTGASKVHVSLLKAIESLDALRVSIADVHLTGRYAELTEFFTTGGFLWDASDKIDVAIHTLEKIEQGFAVFADALGAADLDRDRVDTS